MSDNCTNCGNILKPGGGCGCLNCPPGQAGADGADGLSAYEVWIADGNVGTETDFLDSLVGPPGADGADGVPAAKENFYSDVSSEVEVSDSLPDPTVYHFPPGYGGLSYTNTSGDTKKYYVGVSYDCLVKPDNSQTLYHVVDGAIVKTVAAVDSVEYESLGEHNVTGSLYDGPLNTDLVDRSATTPDVETTVGDNVEFRFGTVNIPINVAFFRKVTLADGESVSLKFKSPEPGVPSTLLQAQIFVLEID